RLAQAYEDGSITAPRLTIEYDPNSIPSGTSCRTVRATSQILNGTDDAEQRGSSMRLADSTLEMSASSSTAQRVGYRFNNIKVPQGAVITSAFMEFTASAADTSTVTLTINGQAADNPGTFTSANNNISGRTTTTSSVSWALNNTTNWVAE